MLTIKDGLTSYAVMMNTLSSKKFEDMLAEDFVYESQIVLSKLEGKKAFIDFIRQKLNTIKNAKSIVYAELAQLEAYGQKDCVLLAQDSKDNLIAASFVTVSQNKIIRLDMCVIPDPKTAIRTGIYPSFRSN